MIRHRPPATGRSLQAQRFDHGESGIIYHAGLEDVRSRESRSGQPLDALQSKLRKIAVSGVIELWIAGRIMRIAFWDHNDHPLTGTRQ